jgi:hypothetical protein
MLANGFIKNRKFGAKTDQNYVFLGPIPHIVDHLSKTILYMSFYGFWKKIEIFTQNP